MKRIAALLFIIACLAFTFIGKAEAVIVDLTDGASSTPGTVNEAIFEWTNIQTTGTGVIDPFSRIHNNGTQQGYNTYINNIFNGGNNNQYNHPIPFTTTWPPLYDIGGTLYRQFLLDINENTANALLSLDEIQIFLSDEAFPSNTSFDGTGVSPGVLELAGGVLIYRLDAGEDSTILLDFSKNPGSGAGDMFAYIPNNSFTGDYDYVYFYSRFGGYNPTAGVWGSDDGFEEWSMLIGEIPPPPPPPVPEPTTMILLGGGLLGLAVLRRKRS